MNEKCIPFYLDNNSCNLPFYLIKDSKGNDVIYINEKNMIYTNTRNNDINRQLTLFTMCFNHGICSIYKVNNDVSIIKQFINNDIILYISTNNDFVKIYEDKYDYSEGVNIHFNSRYLCVTLYEYGEAIPDIVSGYDFICNKHLDCNDFYTSSNLYKSLVEIRRCRFDVIISILKGEILTKDSDRLFRFMSFILDKKIDNNNYKDYISIAKKYIIKKYPDLLDINIDDISNLEDKSKEYGINYFCFNRIDKKIDNLKYIDNKVKMSKKRQLSNCCNN